MRRMIAHLKANGILFNIFIGLMLLSAAPSHTAQPKKGSLDQKGSQYFQYKSKHGFVISYPSSWKLDAPIERYSSPEKAEKLKNNYFSLLSNTAPPATIKINVVIFDDLKSYANRAGDNQLVDGLITQSSNSIVSAMGYVRGSESVLINGKKVLKVYVRTDEGLAENFSARSWYSYYYRDGNKGAVIIGHFAKDPAQIEQIAKSFRFIEP